MPDQSGLADKADRPIWTSQFSGLRDAMACIHPGKKDGLYWPDTQGSDESPLGELFASARTALFATQSMISNITAAAKHKATRMFALSAPRARRTEPFGSRSCPANRGQHLSN